MKFTKVYNARASGQCFAQYVSRSRRSCYRGLFIVLLARVVRKVDKAIHRINHYPVDRVVCFVNTYPLDSDLSGG